ncbi:biliverdin-producing heme oxygenase [Taibaiella koreensis]|uniref:biliverdin-producing heme oxygenase n=1 Tax=Taibaiella koreensis TaxID=1268548 RepID=UPI0013C35617|nr:biliverdin-producing heme oxygenase [Taibaiella koreensis]
MFHEAIKEATREAHQHLEKQVILQLKQIRTPMDYGALLSKFCLYFNALEQKIAPHINTESLPDYDQRRKAHRLHDDLATTGFLLSGHPAVSLPVIGNVYHAFGALYVMEGSVMGGGIIIKMLKEKCGIHEGYTFFQGYGDHTPAMWQYFIGHMNTLLDSNAGAAAMMIDSAKDTFEHFSILFQPHEQETQL